MKKFSIILILGMFFAFLFYQIYKSDDFQVLRVDSPTQIVVDLNKNGVEDDGETINLNIDSFYTKPNKAQEKLVKRLKITNEDAIGLGFLANNFAKETLESKKVNLKTPSSSVITNLFKNLSNNHFSNLFSQKFKRVHNDKNYNSFEIIVDHKNYEDLLIEKGFALKKGQAPTKQLLNNIEKVKNLKLVIINNKNHKYHKLTCKYGLMAHNSQILPLSQLPKDAKPCKFCFDKHKKYKKHKKHYYFEYKYFDDVIPNIKSPAVVFQSGLIKIFLTDMTKVLKPSNTCNTAVCKALVQQVNSAQKSIDFAIYGYTKIPALQIALLNAQKRGVIIRFVYDSNKKNYNIYPDTNYLSKLFVNNQHDYTNYIMHDKFFIFDNRTVFTGSANISNTDMSGFNSNAIILINSPQVASIYEKEFEQMYEGTISGGRFHKRKLKIRNKNFDENFRVYFSPKDHIITEQIIPLIDNAHKYIYIPAFLITQKQMAQSLINASKRGVAVKIILDATNTHDSSSKLKLFRQHKIQVKTENFAGKLHSKSIIIDDLYTVIGSMNFSKSGEDENDENVIIIRDKNVALFYKTFFQYLWKRIPDKWLKYNARAESPDSIGSCSDGIDNDFDGKIDMADDSCKITKKKSYKSKKK